VAGAPVRKARKDIREQWGEVKIQEAKEAEHKEIIEAVTRAEQTAPKGQAGKGLTTDQAEQIIQDLLEDLGVQDDAEQSAEIREEIQAQPITLKDGRWPGKEIFEIAGHQLGNTIRMVTCVSP